MTRIPHAQYLLDGHRLGGQRLRGRWAILLITLVAAALRLTNLGAKSLWYDEAMLRWIASGSPATIVAQNAQLNSTPLLFPLLIGLIGLIDDWSRHEITIRLLPALAGIAVVPLIYQLARRVTTPARAPITARVVAALVAVAPSQIVYAQQLREYSLAVALATALILAFLRFMARPTWRHSLVMGLITAVALLTQYGLALLILACNLVMLIVWLRPHTPIDARALARWIAGQSGAALAALGAIVSSLRFQFDAAGFGAGTYLGSAYWDGTVAGLWRLLAGNTRDLLDFTFPWGMLWGGVLLLGLITAWRGRDNVAPARRTLITLLGVTLLVVWGAALARFYPYQGDRQLLFLTPLLYVGLGLGIAQLWRIIAAWQPRLATLATSLLVIALLGVGLVRAVETLRAPGIEQTRPVIATLEAARQPGDALYVYYAARPALDFYTRHIAYGTPDAQAPFVFAANVRHDFNAHVADIQAGLDHGARLWLLFTHCYLDECARVIDYAANLPGYTLTVEAATGGDTGSPPDTMLYLLTPD